MHAEVVFIDTNLFEQLAFDFTHPTLRLVCKDSEVGDIVLVTTEVTLWEIRNHIEKFVHEANAAVKKHRVLKNIGQPLPRESAILEKCLASYESFLRSLDTRTLTISPAASRLALEMYLEKKPPFIGSKRHQEFPDAYVIAAIAEYVDQSGRTIIVCSAAKGFTDACKHLKNILIMQSLKDLLEHVSKGKESFYAILLDEVKNAINMNKPDIEGQIRDDVKHIEINISDLYADVEDIEAKNLYFHDDVSILSVAKDGTVALLTFNADYSFSVSGRRVVWDPVDKGYVDIGSKLATVRSATIPERSH